MFYNEKINIYFKICNFQKVDCCLLPRDFDKKKEKSFRRQLNITRDCVIDKYNSCFMRIWHMSKIQIFIFSTQNQHYDKPSNKHKNTCQFHFFYSHKFIWRIYYLHRKKCHMFCLKANLVVLNSLKRNQRHKN